VHSEQLYQQCNGKTNCEVRLGKMVKNLSWQPALSLSSSVEHVDGSSFIKWILHKSSFDITAAASRCARRAELI
jgi:hypothetical protein